MWERPDGEGTAPGKDGPEFANCHRYLEDATRIRLENLDRLDFVRGVLDLMLGGQWEVDADLLESLSLLIGRTARDERWATWFDGQAGKGAA